MQPKDFNELIDLVKERKVIAGIKKDGTKDRFFVYGRETLCKYKTGSSRRGYPVGCSFDDYTKFIFNIPKTEKQKIKEEYATIGKYKRMAEKSSFSNNWIETCKKLPTFEEWKTDLVFEQYGMPCQPTQKSLYDLGVTTGNKIDGKVVSLSRIAKKYPRAIEQLREAIANKTPIGSILSHGRFAGYDISISVEGSDDGSINGFLSLEYKGCGNGYYYLLINDENFIGYDVD